MRDGKARPSPVVEPRPGRLTLDLLREQARSCTACDLYKRATQTVFGEGKPSARIVLVGEQPGNETPRAGYGVIRLRSARTRWMDVARAFGDRRPSLTAPRMAAITRSAAPRSTRP